MKLPGDHNPLQAPPWTVLLALAPVGTWFTGPSFISSEFLASATDKKPWPSTLWPSRAGNQGGCRGWGWGEGSGWGRQGSQPWTSGGNTWGVKG